MRVLISGAGIAGPTLAWWLVHNGFEATLVEHAPQFRRGGYVIDFWGTGYDVADRMGLLPSLHARGYHVREVRMVDDDGRRTGGFAVDVIGKIANDRFLSIPRGELAGAIYELLDGRVETIFGDSIVSMRDTGSGVHVELEHGGPRTFDLVVGADGLHSNVRRLAFPAADVEHYLGIKVAAFETRGYRSRDEDVYVMYNRPGTHISRFTLRGDRSHMLFIFADPRPELPGSIQEQKATLRERFGGGGWETASILDALDGAEHLYFDRVSQIRMDRWATGRVALVGDAAFCVSLLAGQGSALAMTAAYVLAGELRAADGRHEDAFARYEGRLHDLISRKQRSAESMKGFLVPRTRVGLFARNTISRLLAIPAIAKPLIARDLLDRLGLPPYA